MTTFIKKALFVELPWQSLNKPIKTLFHSSQLRYNKASLNLTWLTLANFESVQKTLLSFYNNQCFLLLSMDNIITSNAEKILNLYDKKIFEESKHSHSQIKLVFSFSHLMNSPWWLRLIHMYIHTITDISILSYKQVGLCFNVNIWDKNYTMMKYTSCIVLVWYLKQCPFNNKENITTLQLNIDKSLKWMLCQDIPMYYW